MKKGGIMLAVALVLIAVFVWYAQKPKMSETATVKTSQTTKELVATTVTSFGDHLKNVPLSADEPILTDAIKKEYTPFVTDTLLSSWLQNPESAPGRPTSSPWPQNLEIQSIEKESDTSYKVLGKVIWVTSADLTGNTTPQSQAVTLSVIYTAGSWRIDSYSQSNI